MFSSSTLQGWSICTQNCSHKSTAGTHGQATLGGGLVIVYQTILCKITKHLILYEYNRICTYLGDSLPNSPPRFWLFSWLELGPQQKNTLFCLASGKQRGPQKQTKSKKGTNSGEVFFPFLRDASPTRTAPAAWPPCWSAAPGRSPSCTAAPRPASPRVRRPDRKTRAGPDGKGTFSLCKPWYGLEKTWLCATET